jgi:AmmeMemoRadiSam system protein B/AmmeMemoRadiSam system protein A
MATASSAVRPPAVAGTFYPGEPGALAAEVRELLDGVEPPGPRVAWPKALIVPHAGYVYSGAVAAHAFDELASARGIVKRVVLLGPVHRVPVRGLAVPSDAAFATPLGSIAIDREAMGAVRDLPQVVTSDAAHALEHSLEVQLPFLQRQLGEFSLVPFAVGDATIQEVAQVIERLWGGEETLIVISTDLSHYHPYAEARAIDGATVERIGRFDSDLDHHEACGATPLNGFLHVSKKKGLALRLLAACNSGDAAGGKDRVVGYCAFSLYEPRAEFTIEGAGRTLLAIARAAIEHKLFDKVAPAPQGSWLRQAGASFVTLTRDGELRGCIGSLQAHRPLIVDVAENAVAAAFRDPRFPPMTAGEWPSVRVEVSLLSAPKPLRFADEADLLAQIRPGEDGVILECDGRRGTFLPQVWETLPDKRQFFDHLVRKTGLPEGTRLGRCRVSRYRVAKWKE